MSRIYAKVVIDPNYNRKKPNKKGAYRVHVQIIQRTRKVSILPHIPNIPLKMFQDVETKWIKKDFPNAGKLNHLLGKIVNTVNGYLIQAEIEGKRLTVEAVKEWYLANHSLEGDKKTPNKETFERYFLDKFKKAKRIGDKSSYVSAFNKVKAFNPEAGFNDVDRTFFVGLAGFIQHDSKHKVAGSTAREYFLKVIAVYREWCRDLNLPCNSNLFENISLNGQLAKVKRSLTWTQLDELLKLKFGDSEKEQRMEFVRDVFVFMCYTSRSYNELRDLTFEQNFFYEQGDPHKPLIEGYRPKTSVRFVNPILDKAGVMRQIWAKHHQENRGRFFPKFYFKGNSSTAFNIYLEDIQARTKIDFKINIRTARYTFKSTVSQSYGDGARQQMMGHKRIQTQSEYFAGNSDMFEQTLQSLRK